MADRTTTRRITALALAAAGALALAPHIQAATRTWVGDTSGDWQDPLNWDGDATTPSGNDTVEFGAADNRTVTNANVTVSVKFLDSANGNYSVTDTGTGPRLNAITVAGSASATEHSLIGWRTNSLTIDVQSTQTALKINADWGGSSVTWTKTGVGTLIVSSIANNPGLLTLNQGTVEWQTVKNNNGNFRISGSGGVLTNSTVTQQVQLLGRESSGISATFSGQITENLGFDLGETNAASGLTQTFAGNNSYTGDTRIRGATLVVTGDTSNQGSYTVTGTTSNVDDNGMLRGNGKIGLASGNTVTIANTSATSSQAILYAGLNATDTSTFTIGTSGNNNAVLFGDKSIFRVDIGQASASDRLVINGDLSIASAATLDLVALANAFDGSNYTIATWTGSLQGDGAFGTVLGLADGYQVVYNANSIVIAIPEPATLGLLAVAAPLLLARSRRRA